MSLWLMRASSLFSPKSLRSFSSASPSSLASAYFRTREQDASKHSHSHLGRIYTLPSTVINGCSEEVARAFPFFNKDYMERCGTINEHALLVRKPALEVFDLIRSYSDQRRMQQPLKVVLWGKSGQGKSCTLAHAKHFLLAHSNFVVLDLTYFHKCLRKHREVAASTYKEGQFDMVGDCHLMLRQFFELNKDRIDGLTIHQDYEWSPKEKSEKGDSLTSLVQFGLERPKFAGDIFNVLLKELKLACNNDKAFLGVTISGLNALFGDLCYVNKERTHFDYQGLYSRAVMDNMCSPDEISSVVAIKKLFNNDYKNAVIVSSVQHEATFERTPPVNPRRWWDTPKEKRSIPDLRPFFPFALLGQQGWESMDPFVPVEVPALSRDELDVLIDYYVEHRYLQPVAGSKAGRQEIYFLTAGNGQDFFTFSELW